MNPAEPDLKAIFCEAVDHSAGPERSAYLDRACGEDATFRHQLESLLKAHDEAGGFLGTSARARERDPVVAVAPMLAAGPEHEGTLDHTPEPDRGPTVRVDRPAIAEGPGTTIGPYKLLQMIGEGGMGTVFMAEQTRPVRRKVALKVIKPGMDTGQVVARFEAERQALAIMEHPNIARVLDVGATDTGRPFFVMELVKGVPITEYCDRNQLSPKERLELFIPVCQAIQHAHQKGIIHRDIKPSNVLVTLEDSKPAPKVIDFGVAKAIDQRLTEKTMFTEFGAVIGTLEYMSSEQAEMGALDIDTRSDIYSLGVLLYELLTGSTPLERAKLRTAAYSEVLRRIREEEPAKPSTRLSESTDTLASISAQRKMEPARLTKLVRGDLDWIVMKSLEKDRTRRYETANGFARDVQRYLDGDAVEACPPSASYKLKKFARKHRAGLATAGAFVLLLVAATAVSAGLAMWANRERVRALSAERSAKEQQGRAQDREQMAIDAVRRFGDVVRETPELKNNPSLSKLRATLLKEPQAFFQRLRDRLQADRETAPDSLARLAAASFDLGQLTDEIGDKKEALRAYQESLATWERLARQNPLVTQFQTRMAESHNNIGLLQRATGQQAEALASYEEARAIQERLGRENPSVTLFQRDLAASHDDIGLLQRETGHPAEALESHERARAIFERLAQENPSAVEFRRALVKSYNNIGLVESATGRPAQALESHERARAISERLARENPSGTELQNDLAASYNNIGLAQSATGRLVEALASQEQARAIQERLARENPSVTAFQSELARSYNNLGVLQRDVGRASEAMASFEKGRAIRERLARENPSVTQFQRDLAGSDNNIGALLSDTGRQTEALASHERARATQERLARENPSVTQFQSDLAGSHNNIGVLQSATGQQAESLASFEQARAIWERLASENPSVTRFQYDLATSHHNIGALRHSTGRPAEELASFEQARAIRQRLARENPSVTEFQSALAASHHSIGVLQRRTGRAAEAMASLEQARAIRERLARAHPASAELAGDLGATLNNMAMIDLDQRKFDEARAKLLLAIEWQRKALAANPRHSAYRRILANHLTEVMRAAEGVGRADLAALARRELAELVASDPAKEALDLRLTAVVKGSEGPKDNAERIRLAYRAYEKALHASSARLFAEALADAPRLADDRQTQHRFSAASAAALAGSGQGKDDPPPDEAARAKLRHQALDWLKAELGVWVTILDAGPAEMRAVVPQTIKRWKTDTDLAGIRDEKDLAKLSDDERAAFTRLWSDVDQLLTRLRGGK